MIKLIILIPLLIVSVLLLCTSLFFFIIILNEMLDGKINDYSKKIENKLPKIIYLPIGILFFIIFLLSMIIPFIILWISTNRYFKYNQIGNIDDLFSYAYTYVGFNYSFLEPVKEHLECCLEDPMNWIMFILEEKTKKVKTIRTGINKIWESTADSVKRRNIT